MYVILLIKINVDTISSLIVQAWVQESNVDTISSLIVQAWVQVHFKVLKYKVISTSTSTLTSDTRIFKYF